jgi:hypothetical protein
MTFPEALYHAGYDYQRECGCYLKQDCNGNVHTYVQSDDDENVWSYEKYDENDNVIVSKVFSLN